METFAVSVSSRSVALTLLHRLPACSDLQRFGLNTGEGRLSFQGRSRSTRGSLVPLSRGVSLRRILVFTCCSILFAFCCVAWTDQRLHCPLVRRSASALHTQHVVPLSHLAFASTLTSVSHSAVSVSAPSALLLEGRDNLLLDSSLRRISNSAPFGSPASTLRAHRASLSRASLGAVPTPASSARYQRRARLQRRRRRTSTWRDDDAGFQDEVVMEASLPSQHLSPLPLPTPASFTGLQRQFGLPATGTCVTIAMHSGTQLAVDRLRAAGSVRCVAAHEAVQEEGSR